MKNQLVIFFNQDVLVVLDCTSLVKATNLILDWYADKYGFERQRLSAQWADVIDVTTSLKKDLGI